MKQTDAILSWTLLKVSQASYVAKECQITTRGAARYAGGYSNLPAPSASNMHFRLPKISKLQAAIKFVVHDLDQRGYADLLLPCSVHRSRIFT